MNPTFENAIEIIKALPMPEREKFFDWAEEEKHREQAEKAAKKTKLKDEQRKFELAMKWLDENRQKYLGKWVCLDGDKLIAFGADGLKFIKKPKQKVLKFRLLSILSKKTKSMEEESKRVRNFRV